MDSKSLLILGASFLGSEVDLRACSYTHDWKIPGESLVSEGLLIFCIFGGTEKNWIVKCIRVRSTNTCDDLADEERGDVGQHYHVKSHCTS